MDKVEIAKSSKLLLGLHASENKNGFAAYRKKHYLVVALILLASAFSSLQYFQPRTAVAALAASSSMSFQSPAEKAAVSDEDILNQPDQTMLVVADGSQVKAETDLNAKVAISGSDSIIAQDSPLFDRARILADYKNRISEPFHVPPGLAMRVQFWFDVYTKYGLDERVIHSQKYPWLVLKVVDIAPIIYAETPSLRWLRNQNADNVVHNELKKTKSQLIKISHAKNLEHLSEEEAFLVNSIQTLPGKIQRNAKIIADSLRIQTGQKEVFQEGLSISQQFLPQMDEIFKEQKLPTELTRIPLVESSFNHLATSKAGASGVWQFIGNTGKKFLMVNQNIDERRSPIKSTYAAAQVLKEDYMILKHSWPLAVTAYNHGPGGVRHAAKTAKSFDLDKILMRFQSKSFSFASSNYYTEFLAALYAEKYQDEIFGALTPEILGHTQVVRLSRKMHAGELLSKINMPVEDFIDLNPELKRAVEKNSSLPKGFKLHIPTEKKITDPKLFVKSVFQTEDLARNDL